MSYLQERDKVINLSFLFTDFGKETVRTDEEYT
jgi:hypothetical protein